MWNNFYNCYKMKNTIFIVILLYFVGNVLESQAEQLPRLIVTTDININSGDPDDRQSMAHLMLYANELDIRGIIIDRVEAGGIEATEQVIDCYEKDYNNEMFRFKEYGYPHPDTIRKKIFSSKNNAVDQLISEALKEDHPLYVAVWGSMDIVKKSLQKRPEIVDKIRILTIGTSLMAPTDTSVCGVRNWNNMNGERDCVFDDSRFDRLWWIENNWGYNGMFSGQKPQEILEKLSHYGAIGKHFKDVVKEHPWAQYFRAGDTPSIMYFIENENLDNPLSYNWGGYFIKPAPIERPNYYVDAAPNSDWNYKDPCSSWTKARLELKLRAQEMEKRRDEMYQSFINKLNVIYNKK